MKASEREAQLVVALAASERLYDPTGVWAELIGHALRKVRANTVRDVLKTHYLLSIECDHEAGTDTPQCACCTVQFPAFPSVGKAVEAWIEHVLEVTEQ